MVSFLQAIFGCCCNHGPADSETIVNRFRDNCYKLAKIHTEERQRRTTNYFNQLKLMIDDLAQLHNPPRLESLGLADSVVYDIKILRDLGRMKSWDDKKKQYAECHKALEAGFPYWLVDDIVGDFLELDEEDDKKKDAKLFRLINLCGSGGSDCAICLTTIEKADLLCRNTIRLPCGHSSHDTCLTRWLELNPTKRVCVVCNQGYDYARIRNRWQKFQMKEEAVIRERVRNLPDTVETSNEALTANDALIARTMHEEELRLLHVKVKEARKYQTGRNQPSVSSSRTPA